jgi:hypothetical protein
MSYLVPILICALFLTICTVLAFMTIRISDFITKKALCASPVLDADSVAALLSLCFGEKKFYLSRFYPARSALGTVYKKIPLILIFGRKIFVIQVCDVWGLIHNTDEETWEIMQPLSATKKRVITVRNPIRAADEQAQVLRSLLEKAKLPFSVSVEPITVLTAKKHQLENPDAQGIDILPNVIRYIRSYLPKNKTTEKRMEADRIHVLNVMRRYSVSQRTAAVKNNALRQKKK